MIPNCILISSIAKDTILIMIIKILVTVIMIIRMTLTKRKTKVSLVILYITAIIIKTMAAQIL